MRSNRQVCLVPDIIDKGDERYLLLLLGLAVALFCGHHVSCFSARCKLVDSSSIVGIAQHPEACRKGYCNISDPP